jgi:hypothetical protein
MACNVLVGRCRKLHARQATPLCVQRLELLPPQLVLRTTKRVIHDTKRTRCIGARITQSQACLPRICRI